jgi:arylsulfatase A-like enzyme
MEINRRDSLKSASATAALAGLPRLLLAGENPDSAQAARLPRRPDIILFMTDDQGWFDVGYNGHPVLKTPHTDAFCANGLRLGRFYAGSPVCEPTRASAMTGRQASRCRMPNNPKLNVNERALAQVLKAGGCATGHFGELHLGGLISNRYKIIVGEPSPLKVRGREKNKKYEFRDDTVRLYDIVADPGEERDLAEAEPKVLAAMLKQARAWHKEAMAG